MLKIGGIYSLKNNLYIVIFDKGTIAYYGFCFFSKFKNNEKLQESIKNQIHEYKTAYTTHKNYIQWFYGTKEKLITNITGYIGKINNEILIIGRNLFDRIVVGNFEVTYDYCLKKYNCINCKYLITNIDYKIKDYYYICSKDNTKTGYFENMIESVCENFKIKDKNNWMIYHKYNN